MRWLILLVVFFLLFTGCAMFPLAPISTAQQERLRFINGVDQLSTSNRVELLQQLQQDAPDSPWGQRAQTIILYARELDSRKQQLTELREEDERLKQEIDDLRQENQQLTEMIDQLKGLLIEQENRPQ